MAQVRTLTAEDIRDWTDDYELYEGVPRSVAAAPDVSAIAANIVFELTFAARQEEQGIVFGADASFRLARDPDVVYLPDAAFVRAGRVRTRADLSFPFEGTPDFAVEVRSLSDRMSRLDRKMQRYLEAGTSLGWLVDPFGRTVTVHRPDHPIEVRRDRDRLTGDPVLTGLDLSVLDILTLNGRLPLD